MQFWIWFHVFVVAMVYLDLKVFHKNTRQMTFRSIVMCSLFWVGLALGFNILVGKMFGADQALTFFTAYLLEASLSIDNLFVFITIFSFFKIEPKYQHRVLFLGILGALVCRIVFIMLGIALLQNFSWMYFVFGAILILSAIGIYRQQEEKDLSNTFLVKIARRWFRLYEGFHDGHFFVVREKKLYATTLFLTLFLVEASDILFAIDSVPAVLAITSDPFIAYTSNVFAVLGLRSFYFFLVSLKNRFTHLKHAIVLILFFIGGKMVLMPFLYISALTSLIVIASILALSILYSKLRPNGKKQ